MKKQIQLPGVSARPTKADMKALIAHRLEGYELRQAARRARRVGAKKPGAAVQLDLKVTGD